MPASPFYLALQEQVRNLGGLHNAHLHLDRANTLADGYVDHGRLQVLENSYISLQKKHALIASIHEGPAYETADLRARLEAVTDDLVAVGTRLADTMVDVTADRVDVHALETVLGFATSVKDRITIRAAAYTPLGFKKSSLRQWEVFERGAQIADFIGCLPEADDLRDYPMNIGFEEHCVRMLDLAFRQEKMLHVHTDQRNEPTENGTERLISIARRSALPASADGSPMVWAVHMVSPSTYDDARFERFVDGLLETNIGVICCPSAAIGMRQLRPLRTPTFNSIPRILELAAAGVRIRLGSDNIADICSPSSTANLYDEILVLSNAIRYYKIEVLAKFAAGVALDADERAEIEEHLRRNEDEIRKVLEATG